MCRVMSKKIDYIYMSTHYFSMSALSKVAIGKNISSKEGSKH